MFVCAISGVPPKEPVASLKSGAVFEKALVEEYIQEHNKDPITNEPLTTEDLLPLRLPELPVARPPAVQSIPSLLSAFQNEWDSVALELFQLRKQLEQTRKELSTALYHHDAAVRVAASAIKERDEAKAALQQLATSIGSGDIDEDEDVDAEGADEGEQNTGNGKDSEPEKIEPIARITKSHSTQKNDVFVDTTVVLEETTGVDNRQSHDHEATGQLNTDFTTEGPLSLDHKMSKVIITPPIHKPPFKHASTFCNLARSGFTLISPTGIIAHYSLKDRAYERLQTKDKTMTCAISVQDTLVIGHSDGSVTLQFGDFKTYVHKQPIAFILKNGDVDNEFVTVDTSGVYALHDLQEKKTIYTKSIDSNIVAADEQPDGPLFALASTEERIYVLESDTGKLLTQIEIPGARVLHLRFSSQPHWMFVAYEKDKCYFLRAYDLALQGGWKCDNYHDVPLKYHPVSIRSEVNLNVLISFSSDRVEVFQLYNEGKRWIRTLEGSVSAANSVLDGCIARVEPNKLTITTASRNASVYDFTFS